MADETVDDEASSDPDSDFRAMLAGIRTTLPGSQVLLGFLMTVPLQGRFESLAGLSKWSYVVALVASATSSVLLIAPSAQARVRYPVSGIRRRTRSHIASASYLALAGTVLLLVALVASMLFAASVVVSTTAAVTISSIVGVVALTSWFAMPLVWTIRERDA